ncbi:4a-hydroxytetrahydrobiopterin dehydratase [Azospirillum fermentarium]|uniref:4a-hydroxytetrahydrobiopterin dehydratase n=1 Tax=Azospirillum fermentarium TaxID=1233114 RepID=UPI002227B583|nr:4a-hydroxytetrahydrobiopterin dehydratase [Azospirillum fermentarium]MCW2245722.1 4a-hydroxytetrahydrobiopterin dehydratase [Azospirillum fermentarium]
MTDTTLAAGTCEPCRGGIPPMGRAEAEALLPQVPGWTLTFDPDHLVRTVRFPDFIQAQDFAVKVGGVCEEQGHHADIAYGWGYCTVTFWTHKIDGLHRNDFTMAAKVNALLPP